MAINCTIPIILSDDVAATRDFYADLIGFEITFDNGWFVELHSPTNPSARISIWQRDHELIDPAMRHAPQGVIVNILLDDVDSVHRIAVDKDLPIVLDLRNEGYGMRRFITKDPSGTLVDISTPIEMSQEFVKENF